MAQKGKKKNTIAYIVIGAIFVAIIVVAIVFNRKDKIPPNAAETVGNTAGNLNNGGLFCESDGMIYFANAADDYSLYAMDPVSLEAHLISDIPVSYINAAGEYLYFYYNDKGDAKFMGLAGNMRGIYRIPKDGSDTPTSLDRTTSGIVSLLGNNLYYQHYDKETAMTLYSCALDGSEKGMMLDKAINPSCILHANIYYSDRENKNYLSVLNPSNGSVQVYLDVRGYNPIISGDYMFYMDVDDDYKLYRYNMFDGSLSKITNERIDVYNVYENYVFYQTNSSSRPRLVRMMTDGSNPEIIAEGNYTDVNCTSTYTFFRDYDDETSFYMTPTSGMVYVTDFVPNIVK